MGESGGGGGGGGGGRLTFRVKTQSRCHQSGVFGRWWRQES